ncbi:hypothetical protein TVAG_310770 [Trichomonas vaginalis G3]|uniref:Uncharacterized protein n=1 Tax=Trichomonas vaginalis (strain ATCC PRA-98 / G3) TaxID=412133 RepID=A2GFY8_TRIV3|nr:hypothetical protein TVAGG3_0035170 [Trichomonas vaginalis G3]EAX83927.1 hypothetical protein TVAG_310770 [Trichomonas vaginalis G3]KAI5540331.1 hypothetical protein TVAGG3_0035170 [Trichomonas vaginalis G3]|eukprot:XP_001296857.1 hypothetical protein [Trichomonas vaginalis G3]
MKEPILCHITCITIPRVLPSDIYVSYIFNGESGSLPSYSADEPVLTTEDQIALEWDTKEPLNMFLSLNAFNKNGYRYQIGNGEIQIPIEVIRAEKKPTLLIEIDSKIGKFTITIQFEKGIYDDEVNAADSPAVKGTLAPLEQYSEIISQLKTQADKIHPASDV